MHTLWTQQDTCTPVADSCCCMAKPIQYCKVNKTKQKKQNWKKKELMTLCNENYMQFIKWSNDIFLLLLFSHSVVSDSLWPHGLQHARLPCLSLCRRVCSNSCPSSWWCHPTISSSVTPFSSRLQSFPASGSFPMSWLFAWGGRVIGASASASVLPINIQGWFPLGLTGLISI